MQSNSVLSQFTIIRFVNSQRVPNAEEMSLRKASRCSLSHTSLCLLSVIFCRVRLAFHWRGFGPHGRVKEWCAVSAHHSLTQPCGPKPRQWKAGLSGVDGSLDTRECSFVVSSMWRPAWSEYSLNGSISKFITYCMSVGLKRR